ncbi:MAG: hypothetical protein V2B17_00980, partial [Chloroflexota bacterium]
RPLPGEALLSASQRAQTAPVITSVRTCPMSGAWTDEQLFTDGCLLTGIVLGSERRGKPKARRDTGW